MSIIGLGPDGNPIEISAEGDVVKTPSMASDDNMLKMSLVEDKNTLNDRKAYEKIKALNKIKAANRYAKNLTKKRQKDIENYKKKEQLAKIKKQKEIVSNHKNNIRTLAALSQNNQNFENMSGVTGYGLTSDGRKPYLSRPTLDYVPTVDASHAFGSHYDQMGEQAIVPTENGNISSTNGILQGNYTTEHQYLIKNFENDMHNYRYTYPKNHPKHNIQYWYLNIDPKHKQEVNGKNEHYNGVKEVITAAQQGWMWSGWYDDNNNWVSVKVPFVYGLPMDTPNNISTSKRDQWRNLGRWGNTYTQKYFNSIKDVIEAYALFYNWKLKNEKAQVQDYVADLTSNIPTAVQGAAFVAEEKAKAQMLTAQENILSKSADQIKSGMIPSVDQPQGLLDRLIHPMLKYGLVSKKAIKGVV